MKKALRRVDPLLCVLLLVSALLLPAPMYAENVVMGEIQFEGKSHVEKTSGVWVDGGYVGYLKELKGSKRILLLPGEHVITVRQDGYRDFTKRIFVQPGQKEVVRVAMEKAPTGPLPDETATVKIAVNPSRAAVFLDGLFVGHVGEFAGLGRGMLVAQEHIRSGSPFPATKLLKQTLIRSLPRRLKSKLIWSRIALLWRSPSSRRKQVPPHRLPSFVMQPRLRSVEMQPEAK